MKTLSEQFEGTGEVRGTDFKRLQKSDTMFMYELTERETGQKRYEVFEIRQQKASEAVLCGKTIKYEEKELYPKSKDFGIWAWCFTSYEKALKKFNNHIVKPKEPVL